MMSYLPHGETVKKQTTKGAVKKQKKRLHPEKSNDAAFFVV